MTHGLKKWHRVCLWTCRQHFRQVTGPLRTFWVLTEFFFFLGLSAALECHTNFSCSACSFCIFKTCYHSSPDCDACRVYFTRWVTNSSVQVLRGCTSKVEPINFAGLQCKQKFSSYRRDLPLMSWKWVVDGARGAAGSQFMYTPHKRGSRANSHLGVMQHHGNSLPQTA